MFFVNPLHIKIFYIICDYMYTLYFLEGADQLIIEVTHQVFPVILTYITIVLFPIIFITTTTFYIGKS